MTDQPLAGLKVLDFTTLLPGPLATLMLAECGADVLKIEPPRGDDMRRYEMSDGQEAPVFALLNAGKRSLSVDLKDAAQRERLTPLIAEADVLVEQFRPGVMERLGLGYEQLARLNPGLVYCSVTGYGQEGPLAGEAGHDLNFMARTGVLALSPGAPDAPTLPPVLAADIAGGSYPAFFNILLALMTRARDGTGQHLDIAMADGAFPFAFWALAQGWAEGRWPRGGDALVTGAVPRYRTYTAKDGTLVAVAAFEDKFWDTFCETIGLPEALRRAEADPATVIAAVGRIIAGEPGAHWRALLEPADCCCGVVETLTEAVQHPHFVQRGLFARRVVRADGQGLPALPLPIAAAFRPPADDDRRAPALGAANAAPGWPGSGDLT